MLATLGVTPALVRGRQRRYRARCAKSQRAFDAAVGPAAVAEEKLIELRHARPALVKQLSPLQAEIVLQQSFIVALTKAKEKHRGNYDEARRSPRL